MDIITPLAVIALAGLIHASFQLSISTLTLLGSRAIGARVTQARLLKLVGGFALGTTLMTLLVVTFATFFLQIAFGTIVPAAAWASTCGLLLGLSVAIWIFYYRREPGTSLWIPRAMARYLLDRTKATRITAEAVALGMTSVLAEALFIVGPVIVAGLVIIELTPALQLAGVMLYGLISLMPFLFVTARISGGHSIGKIQLWRINNKGFLQFISGLGLIVLAFYIYVTQVSAGAAFSGGGF